MMTPVGTVGGSAAAGPPIAAGEDLIELLTVTQRRVARSTAAVLAEDGATLDEYRLLRSLAATPARTMGELGAALHLPPATVTRWVDGLADSALAYRLPDPTDGRKVVVHLSDRGRARLARLQALVQAHQDALAASLGPDRITALVQALHQISEAEPGR